MRRIFPPDCTRRSATTHSCDDSPLTAPALLSSQILCDGGERHLSKFWSDPYLEARGALPKARTHTAETGNRTAAAKDSVLIGPMTSGSCGMETFHSFSIFRRSGKRLR